MSSATLEIGCCAGAGDLAVLRETPGVDFVELPVARALMGEPADYGRLVERIGSLGLAVRAANILLPPELKVVGPEADHEQLAAYSATAFDRAARLGIQVIVFGSGRSRSVPPGFELDRALDQFEAAVRLVLGQAVRQGMTLAVEPLHSSETNLLTSLAQSASFLRERDLAGARLTADIWHMLCEGEDLSALAAAADLVAHAHVAAAERWAPGRAPDEIEAFLRCLHDAGYTGACSIECRWSDFPAEVGGAVARVREASVAAGWSAP
ncbi:MAG TPA: TIM barrel protein [Candidatus Dormibacteraeota bacterium]